MILPESILAQRNAYRDDTDMLQQWINASCEIDPKGWMWLKEAHSSYTQFLKDENFKSAPRSQVMSKELKDKGFGGREVNGRAQIMGISLKTSW